MKLLLAHIEKVDQAKEEEEKETGEVKGASTGKVNVCENCVKEIRHYRFEEVHMQARSLLL